MRGIEDGKGLMRKGSIIMRKTKDMSEIEIEMTMTQGNETEDKMMIIEPEGEILVITEKTESQGDEMMEE